jgi:hypothetical protein
VTARELLVALAALPQRSGGSGAGA